ncbi:MAG: hypothetical protein K2K25_08125, partial [Muribaculaceae bacterium]|nr:hypothetical protein [Muribaculaceae bacterium]
AAELRRLGYILTIGEDTMAWDGDHCDPDPEPLIRTYLDHRMAMAFAPAKLIFPKLRIEDSTVVEKSFPDYWQEIRKLCKSKLKRDQVFEGDTLVVKSQNLNSKL